ncbi:FAD-binding oxidoreductase [Oceanobacillus sp. J11TS1]|uniref:NAD(P)/FAD-dependent oxidoreductase n=1 Tax=Oceanobacillus sp. J11TS1 TaxID=2807191 RepID=UPI001B14EF4D|nr:FAD-dependent oxidoreductase [Oceanobacillus sp. J11TS1]GIO24090.1 putative oxidoreductase YurR [Oceanobacillus sp. J11TS1]
MKIIVVGAGIAGASAAYYLVKQGVEVIMVDRPEDGKATSAGAGIICPWISHVEDPDWYAIAKRGALFYPELIEQLRQDGETDTGYKKVGAISVSKDPSELDEIERQVREKQREAPELGEVERLDHQEAKKRFPALSDDLAGVYVSGAARMDGRLLSESMKRAAIKNGAHFVEGEASLIINNQEVTGVHVDGEDIEADNVLLATGAWAPELLKPLGIDLAIEPQRGQIAHISLPGQDTADWPVVLPQTSHYMLAFDDSRVVAGATRETGAGFDYRLTAGGVQHVLEAALDVASGLGEGTLKEVRIGFRPMSPDGLPLIGPIDGVEKLYIANGLGRSGLTMGPYVGQLAAKQILQEDIEIDMSRYKPDRAISKSAIS